MRPLIWGFMEEYMLSVLKSGGILIIPIILCGFIATFIVIERIFYFLSIRKQDKLLYSQINPLLERRDFSTALDVCNSYETPTAQVVGKALAFRNYSPDDIKDAVMTESTRQIPRLEKFLTSLGTIANIATLLGLLGTVTGNIRAFGVLGAGGTMGNPAVLAGAIAEALVTTASGLVVSIPSLIFHNFFVSRANRIILDMENTVTEMILKYFTKPNM